MLQPILRFILICFLCSCARSGYFQSEAIYNESNSSLTNQLKIDSVWATAGKHYKRSKLHSLFWGKHYREVWAAPVQVPVLNLGQVKGGLIPAEMGGGLQTTSLALLNPEGQVYTLRTLDKDPAKSLSPFLQKTFVSNIMRDQTSAINPYASFTIPPLAEAANIFHTNPQIYYVPHTEIGLEKYQHLYAGKLVMLEEKFTNKKNIIPAFGEASDIINTDQVVKQEEKTLTHRVDQLAYARARLFDVLISDFDRHEGQWNWAVYNGDSNQVIFKPIPKDRDYAYYQYADGLIPWILTRRLIAGQIKPFIHNIPDVGGIIYKARDLDERFLNKLSSDDWAQVATDLQHSLTPAVIEKAMAIFPDSVFKLTGKKTEDRLNNRVEQLPVMAQKFYKILAKEVTILGSEKKERFVVKQKAAKTTLVEVFAFSDNQEKKPQMVYQRVFTFPETKKIVLNGLSENDEFEISPQVKKGPALVILSPTNEAEKRKVVKDKKEGPL